MVDLATGSAYVQSEDIAETPQHNSIRQYEVLWDTTHGVYLDYGPFGRYNLLVSSLADSGFTISTWGNGVHTLDLSQYDVIVITVGCSWNTTYTQEEIDSLVSYYNQYNQRVLLTGDMNFCEDTYIMNADNMAFSDNIFDWLAESGGILIMGDNPGCNNSNLNPVANAFYMTAGIAALNPPDLYFTNFAVHPIFNGITQLYYRAAGEVAATTPAAAIAWAPTNELTIAALDEFVGIEEGQVSTVETSRMTISPNPFRHSAEVHGVAESETIRIYDVTGSLISSQNSGRVGENLLEGVYFIHVDGYATQKIVKLE